MSSGERIVRLRFIIPADLTDDEAQDAAEQIVTDMTSDYGLGTFEGTDVVDER